MKKITAALLTAAAILFGGIMPAYAEALPDGSVQGLPENLLVMTEEGDPAPDGELYIDIADMSPGELYTKKITVMNLRQDAEYRIFMRAEPNYEEGDINLLDETVCRLFLDGKLIYIGKVDGTGEPNLKEGIDLGGVYKSGDMRVLQADFLWTPEGTGSYGLVSFHWHFYAEVGDSDVHGDDSGGGGSDSSDKSGNGRNRGSSSTNGGRASVIGTGRPNKDGSNGGSGNGQSGDPGSGGNIPGANDNKDKGIKETINSIIHDDDNIVTETAEKVIKSLPFVPESVKTGYNSRTPLYFTLILIFLIMAVWSLLSALIARIKKKKKTDN